MTKQGCGDRDELLEAMGGDELDPCEVCGDAMGADRCPCGPCADCATLTGKFSLNRGVDGKWRCPRCHIQADLKLFCAERPAFRPSVADLYVTAARLMVARR